MKADLNIAVVIPFLNEEQAVASVLAHVPPWVRQIVIADNGSTDQTAAVARSCGAEVVTEPRRGYGTACLASKAWTPAGGSTPTESVTYIYDVFDLVRNVTQDLASGQRETTYDYDVFSRVTAIASPEGIVSYDYDALGRKTRLANLTNEETPQLRGETEYEYDLLGRVEAVQVNGCVTR